jgi:hypothetical protein
LFCLILNGSLFARIKQPYGWFLNLFSHALSPFLVVIGGLGAGLGWLYHATIAFAAGVLGAGVSAMPLSTTWSVSWHWCFKQLIP